MLSKKHVIFLSLITLLTLTSLEKAIAKEQTTSIIHYNGKYSQNYTSTLNTALNQLEEEVVAKLPANENYNEWHVYHYGTSNYGGNSSASFALKSNSSDLFRGLIVGVNAQGVITHKEIVNSETELSDKDDKISREFKTLHHQLPFIQAGEKICEKKVSKKTINATIKQPLYPNFFVAFGEEERAKGKKVFWVIVLNNKSKELINKDFDNMSSFEAAKSSIETLLLEERELTINDFVTL